MKRRACRSLVAVAALAVLASCGKKGPPLAPLRLAPDAAAEFTARRLGANVHLRFLVPTQNVGAQGPLDIDRVEIYAASVAPGEAAPPNRDFLTPTYLVGTIAVRPPAATEPEEPAAAEQPPAGAAPDTRPSPGDPATFVEPLTTEMLNPAPAATRPAVPPPAGATTPALPAAAAAPAYATRIYAVRGVSRGGRPGAPSARLAVPLIDLPPPPAGVTARHGETAFTVEWTPPVLEVAAAPVAYNVYRAESPAVPLNATPTTAVSLEAPGVEFGAERCFSVRTVQQVGGVSIESEPSAPACVTPADVFAPAAPTGLTGVARDGQIALIWNANTEKDLAGYLVLRAEAPGETLQPLTPAPIRDTAYRDTSVTPGVRYVYAIVAIDSATPPNRSPESRREEVTAVQ